MGSDHVPKVRRKQNTYVVGSGEVSCKTISSCLNMGGFFEMSCVATRAILQPRISGMNSHQTGCKFSGCPTSCQMMGGHTSQNLLPMWFEEYIALRLLRLFRLRRPRVVVKKWSMKLVKNCQHLHKFCECPVRQFGVAFLRHFFIIRPDQLTYTATKHLFQRKVIFQPPVWQGLCLLGEWYQVAF